MRRILVALLVILTLSLTISSVRAEESQDGNWSAVALRIEATLLTALKTYEQGASDKGMEEVADVYFGVFEAPEANMEVAVRRFLSLKESTRLEKNFTDIRRAMHNSVRFKEVRKMVLSLIEDVKDTAARLDKKGVGLETGFTG